MTVMFQLFLVCITNVTLLVSTSVDNLHLKQTVTFLFYLFQVFYQLARKTLINIVFIICKRKDLVISTKL